MKILHLLQSNRFSGAENVICQIVHMMKDQKDLEMVYCSRDGQIREALSERNIPFVPLKKLNYAEVRRVIKEQKPDLIHAHDVGASVLAAVAAPGTKVISHMHVNHENMSKVNFKTILYLLSTVRYKHIFWVSNSCFDKYRFKSAVAKKSSVLYNVMDKNLILQKVESDSENYQYDAAYVGRITYQKYPEKLMRVIQLAAQKKPDIKFAVVGTGELFDSTKALAEELDITSHVDFLGFKANPLKLVQDSKCLVLTSRFEGTPMIALEAMALGTPIVSTPTDGMVDLITDGFNGFLTEDEETLAEKIVQLAADASLRDNFSKATSERFDKMTDLKAYKNTLLSAYFNAN